MRKDLTEIIAVIDRSGSMQDIAREASGAFNRYIADQRTVHGECRLTLAQFDDRYDIVHDGADIRTVPEYTIMPRGMTAMNDAIGKTISTVGARLAATPEDQRPGRVLVVIVTDGQENSSKEYTSEAIKAMIETQQKTYSWAFEFLAANIDTAATSAALGIDPSTSTSYDATPDGVTRAYRDLSMRTRSFRGA